MQQKASTYGFGKGFEIGVFVHGAQGWRPGRDGEVGDEEKAGAWVIFTILKGWKMEMQKRQRDPHDSVSLEYCYLLIQVDQLCIPISMGIREKKSMVQQTG
jgi:hypothetical protein